MSKLAICDLNAETGVIATLVRHPNFILHSEYLKPNNFYNVENGCLYWGILELYKSGVDQVDVMNLTNILKSDKAVQQRINKSNLSDLHEFISMTHEAARDSLEEYKLLVKNVVTCSYKRDVYNMCEEIKNLCTESKVGLEDLSKALDDKSTKISDRYIRGEEVQMWSDRVDDLWEEVISLRNGDGTVGIPSKYPSLYEYFSFEKTELVLLAARMKKGKSALFLNEAIDKVRNGVPTLYIDTEMNDHQFFLRMIANLSGVPIKRIKDGRYTEEENQKIIESRKLMKTFPIVHKYMTEYNPDEIYEICKLLQTKMNLQFVIYDYIKFDGDDSGANYNMLGRMTNFLKNTIAGKLDLAVFAGAQLNRKMEVADSDKIDRYISTRIMWRDKTNEEIINAGGEYGNYQINIPINRIGPVMSEDEHINFIFDGSVMKIEEAKQEISGI